MPFNKTCRAALLAAACLFFVSAPAAFPQVSGGSWAVKASGDRMNIGSFRDAYKSLGFNAFCLEADFVSGSGSPKGSFAEGFGHPTLGIGFSWFTLSDVKFKSKYGHYSNMAALYGTFSRDLLRTRHLAFGYNAVLGLSYSSGYYDPLTNRSNWFFSSPVLLYVGGGGHLTWALSRRLDLEADFTVRHNSSARFAYPNGGLNYWGGGLGVRYRLEDRSAPSGHIFRNPKISEDLYSKSWSIEIYGGGGVHACAAEWTALSKTVSREELARTKLRRWPMASLSADLIYRAGGRFGLGFTADGFYSSVSDRLKWADGILYGEEAVEQSKGYSPLSCGLGIVQEVFYGNVALYVQEGIYLYRHAGVHGEHGPLYERAGFRYYPARLAPAFVSVCIKAHKFKADYLDFTVGIKL